MEILVLALLIMQFLSASQNNTRSKQTEVTWDPVTGEQKHRARHSGVGHVRKRERKSGGQPKYVQILRHKQESPPLQTAHSAACFLLEE